MLPTLTLLVACTRPADSPARRDDSAPAVDTSLPSVPPETGDSAEPEARLRETSVVLVLSKAADAHNNRDVELRLEQMAQGTTQWVTYRSHTVKLQKPFTSDFDAF